MEAQNNTTYQNVRKFFYLIICAILGVVLFLLLQQVLIQGFIILMNANLLSFEVSADSLNLIDSIGTVIALGGGAWYGVWLGSYWYSIVYANDASAGFIYHLRQKFVGDDLGAVSKNDNGDTFKQTTWQLEDLMKAKPEPVEPVSFVPTPAVAQKPVMSDTPLIAVAKPTRAARSTAPKKVSKEPAIPKTRKAVLVSKVKTTVPAKRKKI